MADTARRLPRGEVHGHPRIAAADVTQQEVEKNHEQEREDDEEKYGRPVRRKYLEVLDGNEPDLFQ